MISFLSPKQELNETLTSNYLNNPKLKKYTSSTDHTFAITKKWQK